LGSCLLLLLLNCPLLAMRPLLLALLPPLLVLLLLLLLHLLLLLWHFLLLHAHLRLQPQACQHSLLLLRHTRHLPGQANQCCQLVGLVRCLLHPLLLRAAPCHSRHPQKAPPHHHQWN
jgi:hypothetical protein